MSIRKFALPEAGAEPANAMGGCGRPEWRKSSYMSILDGSFRKPPDSLPARKQVQDDILDEVRLRTPRGICNLQAALHHPVSVVDGSAYPSLVVAR